MEYLAGDPFVPRKVVRVILIVRREEPVFDTVVVGAVVEGFVAEKIAFGPLLGLNFGAILVSGKVL